MILCYLASTNSMLCFTGPITRNHRSASKASDTWSDRHLDIMHLSASTNAGYESGAMSASYAKRSVRSIRTISQLELSVSTTVGALDDDEFSDESNNMLKDKAVAVLSRVRQKLTGLDFVHENKQVGGKRAGERVAPGEGVLDVPEQVDRLITLATSNEHLCLSFFGWCPFW